MEILSWINKHLKDIEQTHLFRKYFDGTDLEKIAPLYLLINQDLGISVILRKNLTVNSIYLFSQGYNVSNQFCDDLPYDIRFTFSSDDIRNQFGEPNEKSGGNERLLFGKTALRDKYLFSNHYVQLEYNSECDSINLLTIGSID
jgi:hypothetical protein